MRKIGGGFKGSTPTKVPSPGAASSVGPKPPKLPKPQGMNKNTRDYGKALPQQPLGQPADPFGPGVPL